MRNVLIISTGATPQVVTETIWALARQPRPFIPDELILATTAAGERASHDLLLGPNGKIAELCAALGIGSFPVQVIPASRAGGSFVDDIRKEADAIAFGDLIAELVRVTTADEDTKLHLSLAGGRKTMSYHAGAAMTLFGRAPDQLSHILVRPPALEGCRDFWWPGQPQKKVPHSHLTDRNGASLELSTREQDVQLNLVTTPFYRARIHLPETVLNRPLSYKEVIIHANLAAEADSLIIDVGRGHAHLGGISLKLDAMALALLALLVERGLQNLPAIQVKDFAAGGPGDPYARFLQIYEKTPGSFGRADEKDRGSDDGIAEHGVPLADAAVGCDQQGARQDVF